MYRLPLSARTIAPRRLVSRTLVSNNHFFVSRASPSPKPLTITTAPFRLTLPARRHITMDAKELKSYLADAPPSVVRLEIAKHFDALTDKQKRYAHYISK